ncbi:MAG: hypothetical protein NTU49_10165 [Gammaproteobacteria bacterium]|nr:hypothetical protein [Gammaproteobacteria bacterium]
MQKRCFLLVAASFVSTLCLANPLWHCAATNDSGAVWNWFGATHDETHKMVEKQCEPQNNGKYCGSVCFPPKNYWRCLSHDTPPVVTDPKILVKPKQGTWFWTSSEGQQIAVNGARDACRHNSPYGGCFVDPNACSSTNPADNLPKVVNPAPSAAVKTAVIPAKPKPSSGEK